MREHELGCGAWRSACSRLVQGSREHQTAFAFRRHLARAPLPAPPPRPAPRAGLIERARVAPLGRRRVPLRPQVHDRQRRHHHARLRLGQAAARRIPARAVQPEAADVHAVLRRRRHLVAAPLLLDLRVGDWDLGRWGACRGRGVCARGWAVGWQTVAAPRDGLTSKPKPRVSMGMEYLRACICSTPVMKPWGKNMPERVPEGKATRGVGDKTATAQAFEWALRLGCCGHHMRTQPHALLPARPAGRPRNSNKHHAPTRQPEGGRRALGEPLAHEGDALVVVGHPAAQQLEGRVGRARPELRHLGAPAGTPFSTA